MRNIPLLGQKITIFLKYILYKLQKITDCWFDVSKYYIAYIVWNVIKIISKFKIIYLNK